MVVSWSRTMNIAGGVGGAPAGALRRGGGERGCEQEHRPSSTFLEQAVRSQREAMAMRGTIIKRQRDKPRNPPQIAYQGPPARYPAIMVSETLTNV